MGPCPIVGCCLFELALLIIDCWGKRDCDLCDANTLCQFEVLIIHWLMFPPCSYDRRRTCTKASWVNTVSPTLQCVGGDIVTIYIRNQQHLHISSK